MTYRLTQGRGKMVFEKSRSAVDDESQGYSLFIAMEDLLEKLKSLNYDEEAMRALKMRPLNRHYFAVQTNPGEQFFMFTALSTWLIQKNGGVSMTQPQEYDDPNSTIATILDAVRNLGIPVDFSPNKLKAGFGPQVISVLSGLANKILDRMKHKYLPPQIPKEVDEVEAIDDDMELILDKVEEGMADEISDIEDDDDDVLNVDDFYPVQDFAKKPEEVLESTTSLENWNLELERVLPQLKVSIKSNMGDWRNHLENMKNYQSGLNEALSNSTGNLRELSSEIKNSISKINKRENLINGQLENLLDTYRSLRDEFSIINQQYKEANEGTQERQRKLAELNEKLNAVKRDMDERGATMSDGSPLIQIKKAIKDIKREICEMGIHIAVIEHSLLRNKIREKSDSQYIRSSGLN